MFGYLFPTKESLTLEQRKIFRDYYCSICLSHRYRYGLPSILFNNYDIAVFGIVLNLYNDHIAECGNCGKRIHNKSQKFSAKKWSDIVDYNVNLVRKKIDDDISDQKNPKTALLKLASYPIFVQCKQMNAALYSLFEEEYDRYIKVEQQKPPFSEIVNAYERFVKNTFAGLAFVKSPHLELLVSLNRWIYWIDAVNDFDEDSRNSCYNPYVIHSGQLTKLDFLRNLKEGLLDDYELLIGGIRQAYANCGYPRKNRIILENIIGDTIPKVTNVILSNGALEKRRKLL